MYQSYISALRDELALAGYSPRTIQSYSKYLAKFLHYTAKPVDSLSSDDLRLFLLSLIQRKVSTSYINSVYSAVRIFFIKILRQPFSLSDIPRVRKSKRLPIILSRSEVDAILCATSNLKHRTILMLTYSSGLRVSEAVHLKVADIDSMNHQLLVHSGKGDKDRYTLLSHQALLLLRQYYKVYRPSDWLFPSGYNTSTPLSSRTVQKVFSESAAKAGILKKVTIHTLRHSFATHLLMMGTDIHSISRLLGHSSLLSTAVYLNLAPAKVLAVTSPLDRAVTDFE